MRSGRVVTGLAIAGACALALAVSPAGRTTIPVVLRSLIDVARGGAFSGVLTGGNGRPPGEGPVAYYQFRVPTGRAALSAGLTLANDPAVTVAGYLIAPAGETAGFGSNAYAPQQDTGPSSVNGRGLNVYATGCRAVPRTSSRRARQSGFPSRSRTPAARRRTSSSTRA